MFRFFLGAMALGTLSGCGDPLSRQKITGEVKLKGQPLDDGIIHFHPQDGQGTGDGAQIVKGQYEIPLNKGLSPGKYRVTIYAGDGRSGTGDASPDSPYAGTKPGKERIPPDYNEKSKVVKEVTKGGANKFDFDIP
ncbi:MAG: hypothetical protein L0Z62_02055 [Gemmataceae bacterium]|nr:hypothetical protein [Gemmataceae bacterium]